MGSPQSVRCCPATVCLPHWVRGAQGSRTSAQPADGKSRTSQEQNDEKGNQDSDAEMVGPHDCWLLSKPPSENNACKTVVINNQLHRLQVDIAALQEILPAC